MGEDRVLKQIISEAAKQFDLPEKLILDIIKIEKSVRYQVTGEKRFVDDQLTKLLEEYTVK